MGLLRYGSGLGAFADSLLKTYMSLEENERANASLKMKEDWQKAQMEEQQRQAALQEIQRQALMQNIEMAKAAEQRRVEEAQRANMGRTAISQTVPTVSSRGMLTGELQPGQAPYRQMNPQEKLNALMPYLDPEKSATALTSILNTGEMANVRQSVAALKAQQDYERQMMRDDIERLKEEGRNKRAEIPNVNVNISGGGPAKAPTGYRYTPDGNLEPITGGPADYKREQTYIKDTSTRDSMFDELTRLGAQAKSLMDHPGLSMATGVAGKFPNIPGSDAANFDAQLGTLKSQTAFSVLQNMRNNSKTGGALGQVSDKEGQLLQDNLGALDKAQSSKAYKESLKKIVDYTEQAKVRIQKAYDMQWGEKQPETNSKRRFTIIKVR